MDTQTLPVSRATFLAYEDVRQEGLTNMFDVNRVIELMADEGVEVDRQDVVRIMKNYDQLVEAYL